MGYRRRPEFPQCQKKLKAQGHDVFFLFIVSLLITILNISLFKKIFFLKFLRFFSFYLPNAIYFFFVSFVVSFIVGSAVEVSLCTFECLLFLWNDLFRDLSSVLKSPIYEGRFEASVDL